MTASWSAGRMRRIASLFRVGWTRLVSSTTYTSAAGSIQSEVPVNPVWPTARADIRVPQDEVGSMVSQPSARELPGTRVRVMKRLNVADAATVGAPRKPAAIVRAKRPTAAALPNSPA